MRVVAVLAPWAFVTTSSNVADSRLPARRASSAAFGSLTTSATVAFALTVVRSVRTRNVLACVRGCPAPASSLMVPVSTSAPAWLQRTVTVRAPTGAPARLALWRLGAGSRTLLPLTASVQLGGDAPDGVTAGAGANVAVTP